MGYSVAVQPRTKELKEKMLAFAKKHFRPYGEVSGYKLSYHSELTVGGHLAYDKNRKRIGFDYSPQLGDREYVYALVRWMALRVGELRDGLPYYVYDGIDRVKLEPGCYDEHGWFTPKGYERRERSFIVRMLLDLGGAGRERAKIKAELHRLSRLWAEENR